MKKQEFILELKKMKYSNIKIIVSEFENEISFTDVYGDKRNKTMFKLWESFQDKLKEIKSEQ
jgi:hypothetical protein